MSLSDLTGVNQEELREKFRLEPLYQYDRHEKDNKAFMSLTILLEDSELRHGGHLELSAKKVLSLVTKDILESKDYTLFQIPEVTCLHMGYGQKSANKEGKMALSKYDAQTWFNVMNLSTLQDMHKRIQASIDDPPTGRNAEGELAEALEIDSQPRRTSQIYDDTVSPCYSGLLIPEKGSNILCMSILILNSDFRSQKQRKKSNGFESSESEEWHPEDYSEDDDIEPKGKIGANKISDFLSFWTLPYLLNYTQRKIQEIVKHHKAEKRDPKSRMKTVKKSSWDIIVEATKSKPECRSKLKEKLEKYYTAEKLHKEYTLLKGNDGSPIVLVPLQYVFHTGNAHPLRLEDLGRKWEWDGRVLSNKEFLRDAFVKQKEVQMDYFNCMKDAKLRQGVDYAFIFPGKVEFDFFFKEVMNANPNFLTVLKHVKNQGRGLISPRHSLMKCSGENLVVCFSYFQGADKGSVAALFRAVGAHYFNHFTAVFLHGSTFSKHDPDCQLGNLYPVRVAEQLSFKQGQLTKSKTDKISFRKGISRFAEHVCPESYGWWMEKIFADPDVKIAIKQFDINPTFDHTKHLKVAFSKTVQKEDLIKVCRVSNGKRLVKRQIGAANFNGHLLSMIQQCGRKDNIGVTLAISNTIGIDDPPCVLKVALTRIMCYFVLAIIKAEPQLVFPSEPDEEDREKIDSNSSLTSTSDADEEDDEPVAKYTVRKPLSEDRVPLKRRRQDKADHRPDSGNSDSLVEPIKKRRPRSEVRRKGRQGKADHRPDSGNSDSSVELNRKRRPPVVRQKGRQGKEDHRPDSGNSDSSVEPSKKRRPPVVRRKEQQDKEDHRPDSGNSDSSVEPNKKRRSPVVRQKGRQDKADHRPDNGNSDSSVEPVKKRRPRSEVRRKALIVDSSDDGDEDDSGGLAHGDVKNSDYDDCEVQAEDDANHSNSKKDIEEQEHEPLSKSKQKPSAASASAASPQEEAPQLKIGVPSEDELAHLANDIHTEDDSWKRLAGRLKIKTPKITAIDNENRRLYQKAYKMLLHWKQANGSDATYEVLFDALTHELVNCRELAEKYCEN